MCIKNVWSCNQKWKSNSIRHFEWSQLLKNIKKHYVKNVKLTMMMTKKLYLFRFCYIYPSPQNRFCYVYPSPQNKQNQEDYINNSISNTKQCKCKNFSKTSGHITCINCFYTQPTGYNICSSFKNKNFWPPNSFLQIGLQCGRNKCWYEQWSYSTSNYLCLRLYTN